MSPKAKSTGKKAAETRKRRAAAKKAAAKRKHRAPGIKAAAKRKHRAAGKKAAKTRVRQAAAKKAAETRARKKLPQSAAAPPATATPQAPSAIDKTDEPPTPALPQPKRHRAPQAANAREKARSHARIRNNTTHNSRPNPHEKSGTWVPRPASDSAVLRGNS